MQYLLWNNHDFRGPEGPKMSKNHEKRDKTVHGEQKHVKKTHAKKRHEKQLSAPTGISATQRNPSMQNYVSI